MNTATTERKETPNTAEHFTMAATATATTQGKPASAPASQEWEWTAPDANTSESEYNVVAYWAV